MNYLKEILAFHSLLEINQLDSTDQSLWYHLMHINNKCGWAEWFTVANMSLQARLGGIDKKTLERHRVNLINAGLIEYKNQGKKQAGKYRIIPVSLKIGGDIGVNIPLETALSVPYLSPNTPLLNKDKQNINETENINTLPDATENERQILNQFKNVSGYPFDYLKDLEYIRGLAVEFPTVDLLEESKKYATWLLDKPIKKNSNPRLQFRNWSSKASTWGNQSARVTPIKRQDQGSFIDSVIEGMESHG